MYKNFIRLLTASQLCLWLPVVQAADTTPPLLITHGAPGAPVPRSQQAELPGSTSVDQQTLENLAPASSDSASLLRNVPGVSLNGAGGFSSLPAIRGLADDRLRIKVDGMDLVASCPKSHEPGAVLHRPEQCRQPDGVCRHHPGQCRRRQHRRHHHCREATCPSLPHPARRASTRVKSAVSIAATTTARAAAISPPPMPRKPSTSTTTPATARLTTTWPAVISRTAPSPASRQQLAAG